MKHAQPHHDFLMKHLRNPAEAAAYLSSVSEDGEIEFILKALRNIVEAGGGIGELSKKTKLSRTTLYKTLSIDGNPEIKTLNSILHYYGIKIGFLPTNNPHRKAA